MDSWRSVSFSFDAANFSHADHLNTPRLVADAAGTTVWKWDQQEPFGNNVADENPSGLGAFDLPLRLPGQYFDRETNLHYNYYRDYDPSLGRYGESDPIGLQGGLNTYAYVGAKPISRRDKFGLAWEDDLDRAFNHPMDQPYPSEFPPIERRPLWPPAPPPPPSEPGDKWPQDEDYRGQCRRLYVLCVENGWTGRCDDCLHYCTTQGEWPLSRCHPRRDNKRRPNSC